MKRFLSWIGLKEKLHDANHNPPHVSEGDIWWASRGGECRIRDQRQERSVLAAGGDLQEVSHGFYFVVPTTTRERTGSWFVRFRQNDKTMIACLHQARSIDHRRLSSKLGTIDDEDFERVRTGFRNLYR